MLRLQSGRPHPSIQRSRFAVTFGLLIGPLLLLVCMVRLIMGESPNATLMTVLVCSVLATILPIQFRWTGWLKPMVGYYIIAGLAIFPVRVVGMGGLESTAIVWAIAPTLLASLLGGNRLAMFSVLVIISELFGIHYMHSHGMITATTLDPLSETITVIACIIFVTGMLAVSDMHRRLYEKHLEGTLMRLEESNNALAIRTHEAQAASLAKDAFLANMSHEIRTPLNGVIGMANVLDQSTLNPKQRQMLGTLRQSAGLLMGTLNDVLDLSRLESGRSPVAMEAFSLRKVIEQSIELHTPSANSKALELTSHIDDTVDRFQFGNARRVQQVLNNLLSNALKFTESGSVHIHTEPEDESTNILRVSVTDTGIGIPPSRLDAIFDRFTQADVRITREHGGTGLGLTISRSLLKTMGGEIGVRSTPGQGSTFWFRLPLPAASPTAEPEPVETRQFPGLRVLLAEDNIVNQRVICYTLERFGIEDIEIAQNGHEALEMLKCNSPYDILILDVEMPKMDGITAAREIRASKNYESRMPIIGLSAHAIQEVRQSSLAAGMNTYLTKPLKPRELADALTAFFPEPTRAQA
ncbi:MAG: ATP-binding protein [Myxococcota bacterium]|nr:ATP-binding protein [Myxococcota bacterium]